MSPPPEDPTTNAPATGSASDFPVSLILAIYGAIVSTGVALYQFFRDRPGVKVFIAPSTTVDDDPDAEERHIELWRIRFVNHRKRPITLEEGGVLLVGKVYLPALAVDYMRQPVTYPFPLTLGDGESRMVQVPRNDMLFAVRGAWARDALGHTYEVRYPGRGPIARLKAWHEDRRVRKEL